MNENTNQKIKDFALKNWTLLLIILLLILSIMLWQRGESKQKTIDKQTAIIKVQGNIEAIEAQLDAMKKREAELYPLVEKKITELEKLESDIEKKRKELANVKKEQIEAQVNQMDDVALIGMLHSMGYAASLTGSK